MRTLVVVGALVMAGTALIAQGRLAQLDLTEAAARAFVLDEIKRPSTSRGAPIVVAGTRAFLKLPPAARAAAATALFAWAKSYVNSAAFNASYASYRKGRIPQERAYALTPTQQVQKDVDEQLAGIAGMREAAAKMPEKDRVAILDSAKRAEAMLNDPAAFERLVAQVTAERAQAGGSDGALAEEVETTTPAEPRHLLARRLREFLNATADVNFSARTIALTGGPDGIEFIDSADRAKPWMWQAAAIVGSEATIAARAAAAAWLKEIER
jgi:hypothetical protein